MAQLGAANARSGPPTAAQRAVDGLASGKPVAGGAAFGAALARGLSPAAALAAAAARDARTSAMLSASTVPRSAANSAVASLGAGGSRAPGTAALVAALAAGRDPAAALARAQASAATLAAMERASTVPQTPVAKSAAGLATGNAGQLSTTAVAALSRSLSPEQAAALAAKASAERQAALGRAETQATDPNASSLAGGSVPTGKALVVKNGVPTLVTDTASAQVAAASVPVAPDDAGVALAAGKLPDNVKATPQLSLAIARALRKGATLSEALAAATAAQGAPAAPEPETLEGSLATGRIDSQTLATLARGTDVNSFSKRLGAALARGASPSDAIASALRNARAANPDDEIAKQ